MNVDTEFREAMRRLLAYAKEVEMRTYRGELANWERQVHELLAKKPKRPEA